jgi:hypothetical protein
MSVFLSCIESCDVQRNSGTGSVAACEKSLAMDRSSQRQPAQLPGRIAERHRADLALDFALSARLGLQRLMVQRAIEGRNPGGRVAKFDAVR